MQFDEAGAADEYVPDVSELGVGDVLDVDPAHLELAWNNITVLLDEMMGTYLRIRSSVYNFYVANLPAYTNLNLPFHLSWAQNWISTFLSAESTSPLDFSTCPSNGKSTSQSYLSPKHSIYPRPKTGFLPLYFPTI